MKKILVSLTSVLMLASQANADQCAYVTKTEAEKAVKAIIETQTIQSLCIPCGESKAETIELESVGFRKVSAGQYHEVMINGQGIDLAYTYVNGLNLAKLVGCPASGVSAALK